MHIIHIEMTHYTLITRNYTDCKLWMLSVFLLSSRLFFIALKIIMYKTIILPVLCGY